MKKIIVIAAFIYIMTGMGPARAAMQLAGGDAPIKVFLSMTDTQGWYALQKGKIISYSSKDEYEAKDLFGRALDKSKATVRLASPEGIREGDTLYVINDSNLITAKMKVRTIFKSASFGYMLVGYGNFRLSALGERVVQRAEDNEAKYAYIYKARGDYYDSTGSQGEAIREYKNALKADSRNPSAHLALGLVYMKQGLDQFALRELQEGYRDIGRLYDNEDKFVLLKSLAEIHFKQVYETFVPQKLKEKYREEGIMACKEALAIYPQSDRINYYLGVFNYRSPNPDDKAAKDYLLRAAEINPSNAEAYVALSELYYRHENMAKARMYAEKAIDADHSNTRAQKMLKYIQSKEQLKQ